MDDAAIRRRPGGRSARVRQSVLDATLQALADEGVHGLTVAEVAARAGVHMASIYRRWGTRERLICDALLGHSASELAIPDTGSVRDDLVAFAEALARYLATPLGAALTHAMAIASDDPALAEARAAFWEVRRDLSAEIVERAIARGEVPTSTDARLVMEVLVAPLHFRVLMTREAIDEALPRRLADIVLDGIGPAREPG